MIKSNLCHIYCLKNGEHIYGMYLFKDAKMQYEDLEGNTLHFYASFINTDNKHLFYIEDYPEAIPYLTTYYKENWGFCLSYEQYKQLNKNEIYAIKEVWKNG